MVRDEYTAVFDIEHGVSHGLGVLYNDTVDRTSKFSAPDHLSAMQTAYEQANHFAREYLAETTGFKKVTLKELIDPRGEIVDQVELMRANASPECDIDKVLKGFFPQGRLFVKRHWIADLAEMANAEN